ncbi:MAG: hypothetical protein AB2A00_15165 [Myxococcota bacterium]
MTLRTDGIAARLFLVVGVGALSIHCTTTSTPADASIPPGSCVPDKSFSRDTARDVSEAAAGETICPVQDQDYWRFSTTGDTLADVQLTRESAFSAVDLSVSVMDSNGSVVASLRDTDGSDGPTSLRGVHKLQPNSTYFLQVMDVGGDDEDNAGTYTLGVTLHAEPDTHEPNDVDTNATPADITAAGNQGWLASTGDVDVYTFDATQGSIIRFTLRTSSTSLSTPVATLTAGDGTTLYTSPQELPTTTDGASREAKANISIRQAGPFKLTVADPTGAADYRPEGQYTLILEVAQDPDEVERNLPGRNDTLATAYAVQNPTTATTLRPALSSVGDADHFVVVPTATDAASGRKLLEVTVSLPAGTGDPMFIPTLTVWDSVMYLSGSASAECTFRVREGGGFLCHKPCAANGLCGGNPGGELQECAPVDPATPQGERQCTEPRIFRRLVPAQDGSVSASVRYPLRSGRNPIVTLADDGTDTADERQFTLTLQIVDDPDTHEPDDLPTPLISIGASNNNSRGQDLAYFPHDSIGPGNLPEPCPVLPGPDGGVPDGGAGCFGRGSLDGGSDNPLSQPIDCGSYEETTQTVTGYLSYQGDRDYYRFEVPDGFYQLDVEYSFTPTDGQTPVELTAFVYVSDGEPPSGQDLRGSFSLAQEQDSINANLDCQFDTDCPNDQSCRVRPGMGVCKRNTGEATGVTCSDDSACGQGELCRPNGLQGGVCRGGCASNLECPNGGVCIGERCFADVDDNPGTQGTQVFGPSAGRCLYAHQCNDRPLWVEVVDNGLNDSDRDTPYTLRIRIRCGCPTICDNSSTPYCSSPIISCERGS